MSRSSPTPATSQEFPGASRGSLAGWPFDGLDGVLMANSLHYVRAQAAFLRGVDGALRRRRILLVEYDIARANAWVPYPISYASAVELFRSVGYGVATPLGRKRSDTGVGRSTGCC